MKFSFFLTLNIKKVGKCEITLSDMQCPFQLVMEHEVENVPVEAQENNYGI